MGQADKGMAMKRQMLFTAVVCFCTNASAEKAEAILRLFSNPPGATLYDGEVRTGVLPYVKAVPIIFSEPAADHIKAGNYTVVWPSGAKQTMSLTIPRSQLATGATYTFNRPKEAPNLELDLRSGQQDRASQHAEVERLVITYYSEPPGAVIYEGTKRFGDTPFNGQYAISEENKARGDRAIPTVTAKWASGATANTPTGSTVYLNKGLSQKFTFKRPDNVAGLDVDLRVANEIRRAEMMRNEAKSRTQAQAQTRNAEEKENGSVVADLLGAFLGGVYGAQQQRSADHSLPPLLPPPALPKQFRCRNSVLIGEVSCTEQ